MTLDREKTLAAAQQAAEQNQFERALGEYRKLLAADPNDARVLLKVGDLQMRAQDFPGAIATYDRVARFYAEQGFAVKALAVYKQVRELLTNHCPDLIPNFGHVLAQLVQLYIGLGLTNEALQTLDEEATRLRRIGHEEAAVEVYRHMTSVSSGSPLLHLRLAEGLCRIGRVDEALTSFWTTYQLFLQAHRNDEALRVVERMLHFKSEPRYALAAAKLYLAKGTSPEGMQALSRLQVCFQADPTNLEVLGLLAEAFAVIGQTDKAIEVQKEIARQAHEQGDVELFQRTLQVLKNNAPEDDQVAALTQLPPPMAAPQASGARSGTMGVPPPKPRQSAVPPKSASVHSAPVSRAPASLDSASLEPVSLNPVSLNPASLAPLSLEPVDDGFMAPRSAAPVPSAPAHEELKSQGASPQARVPGLPPAFSAAPGSAATSTPPMPPPPPAEHRSSVPPPPPLSSHTHGSRPASPPPSRASRAGYASPPSSPQTTSAAEAGLPSLPAPLSTRQSLTPPSEAAERASRLSREIEAVTLSSRPVRSAHPSGAEIDVDDLDLDFGEPDAYGAASIGDALPPSSAVPSSRVPPSRVPPSTGPLSDAVPRPAQLRPAAPSGIDLQDYTRQALQAANSHRAQGQFDRAIEVLHSALEGHPRSIELRETLRDLHAERGDRESAIEEMLTMAAIYLEYGRADHASTVLKNILEAEPTHPRALVALAGVRAMSGAAPRGGHTAARSVTGSPSNTHAPSTPQVHDAFLAASVEEALEESEFFSSRGMLGDARRVLVDQLAQTPNHPLLLEALAEVDKQAPKQRPASKPATKRPTDFNIKEQLNELERVVRESQKPPSMGSGPVSIDVDAVFEKFKAGVRSQVAESDSSTHYDLGLAYKEMNLLDDAIEELKLAARDPERECTCYAMVGLIYAEQKSWDQARKFYSKGLGAMKRSPMQDTALYYELGHVSEMAEQVDQAAYYFRQVLRRDPTFRDARKRLGGLRTSWAPPAESRSGSPDEEVDRAFDELINDG